MFADISASEVRYTDGRFAAIKLQLRPGADFLGNEPPIAKLPGLRDVEATNKESVMHLRTSVGLAIFVTSLCALAQAPADRLTASDVFNLQFAESPQISPDGKKIVYVRSFSDVMSDKRYSNLWLVSFDGSEERALTSGNFGDEWPRWSPDGSRLAYVSDREGSAELYVRWMDTGQTAKLTNLEFAPQSLAWSPDGTRIAFASFVPTAKPKVEGMPTAPEGAKWAEGPQIYDRLIYRFNGRGYLKPGFSQLFIVAADGGAPRQLTSGAFPHVGNLFGGDPPVWTPDGNALVISGNFRTDFEYDPLNTEVYEIAVTDGAVKQLTRRQGPDDSPDLSPDGTTIAYTGFDDRYQGHQTTHLYLMDREGANPREVTPKLDRDVRSPRWAPDGKGIYVLYDDQGDTKLALVSLDGKLQEVAGHLATGGTGGSSYSWGAAFTVARNGNVALTQGTGADPGNVGAIGPREKTARVLTHLNRELLLQKKTGAVEEIWFNSSLDQRKIQGWIVKPPDFDPAKKYPLILEIHGGPFANYGDHFDTIKQIWAAHGYVVLYLNPRGSTSYGEEFANLIHHAYPGDDFYDLNSGVDAALAKGYIDETNLFVTGGSGGGVLTCWMIGRTNRFRAAASLYPVINWYSWTLTSDLPAFAPLYWFKGKPWENMEEYMKRSPILYVSAVKSPTMLITGEEDWRTPITEAEQYYSALKLLKVESVLVRVPGEPHGLQRRPSHQAAKAMYVLDWFEKHRAK
jgi:dipeptidyl aminopeptidase/acylaminoacyl peptidase